MARQSEKLNWYLNRLRCMSVGEIFHRLHKKLRVTTRRLRVTHGKPPVPNPSATSKPWLHPGDRVGANAYSMAADRILAGHYAVFALSDVYLGIPPDWNRDPKTGTRAPSTFGMALDYRQEALVGDIKYLWEPNRHLEFVTLCQAYWITRDERYLEGFKRLLCSWIEQCPYPRGPNWSSSLEAGIRLINWSICWQLIGGAESRLFAGEDGRHVHSAWLGSIWEHSCFIAENWSRDSSANNHLIGEAAGLFIASVTWPAWSRSSAWRAESHTILAREAVLQVHADGVLKEQTVSYLQFVGDFLLIAGLAGRENGFNFAASYWESLERMLDFLASIMDVGGNLPMIGDADDGYAVRLAQGENFCPYRSLLASGGLLFERPDLLAKAGGIDAKTRWLMGAKIDDAHALPIDWPDSARPVRTSFPNGGYYILGTDWETDREIRIVADTGPLGYLSIAAHGHADALAFSLSVGGIEFLVDPGTYSYHTQKAWREYFRGTAAHNTLRVDGLDQSLIGGNFMWLRHARARSLAWRDDPDVAELVGEHDGYSSLPDPVIHRRHWRFEKSARALRLRDTLECAADHRVERCWHFSEGCQVDFTAPGVVVSNAGRRIELALDPRSQGHRVLSIGSDDPMTGWISRGFDRKHPAYSLVERFDIRGQTQLDALIDIG
jgi:hypothetical protein